MKITILKQIYQNIKTLQSGLVINGFAKHIKLSKLTIFYVSRFHTQLFN